MQGKPYRPVPSDTAERQCQTRNALGGTCSRNPFNAPHRGERCCALPPWTSFHISLGRAVSCQHGAFSGVGAFVVSFVPAECPVGGGMWGIFGKPLKRAIQNAQICMLY